MKISTYLTESGIRIPKDAKAAKIIFHQDMDGVFSAILTYRQLARQGIDPRNIVVEPIQYGDNYAGAFNRRKGQMIALVDFARLPEGARHPDFWSDHHQGPPEGKKSERGGRTGATEYPSETEHLATIYASGLADHTTIAAISGIDSAKYSHLEDVINLPKDFRSAGRMERLAILSNALLTSTRVLDNRAALSHLIKTTNPSLVAFYNNLLQVVRLTDIQKQAVEELSKENPDWALIEKIRNRMPTMAMRKQVVVKEDSSGYQNQSHDNSGAYMDVPEPKRKLPKKTKFDKHPEKIQKVKDFMGPYGARSETMPNRGDHLIGKAWKAMKEEFADDDMQKALDKGTKKSLKYYQKMRNPNSKDKKNIVTKAPKIDSRQNHQGFNIVGNQNEDVNEATMESIEELEKLQKEWNDLAQQGKDMKDVAPEKWARLKFLTNEYRDKIAGSRQAAVETQTNPEKTKFSKVGDKGLIIKQNPLGGQSVERFVGNLLSKQSGERYPFLFRRYPTFFQVNVNPDTEQELRKNVDLGKVTQDVLRTIAQKFENKYNKWAFDIIRKESGGHASITNVSGLGTLGLMPKKLNAVKHLDAVLGDAKHNEKIVKDLTRSGFEPEQIDHIIKQAKNAIMQTEASRELFKNIEGLEQRLRKLKSSDAKLKEVMPTKWVTLQFLKKFKEIYAQDRNEIMDAIENEFKKEIEARYAGAKVTKPVGNQEMFKSKKRPDTQKEIIQRIAK